MAKLTVNNGIIPVPKKTAIQTAEYEYDYETTTEKRIRSENLFTPNGEDLYLYPPDGKMRFAWTDNPARPPKAWCIAELDVSFDSEPGSNEGRVKLTFTPVDTEGMDVSPWSYTFTTTLSASTIWGIDSVYIDGNVVSDRQAVPLYRSDDIAYVATDVPSYTLRVVWNTKNSLGDEGTYRSSFNLYFGSRVPATSASSSYYGLALADNADDRCEELEHLIADLSVNFV